MFRNCLTEFDRSFWFNDLALNRTELTGIYTTKCQMSSAKKIKVLHLVGLTSKASTLLVLCTNKLPA
jgi:hypothetical protein